MELQLGLSLSTHKPSVLDDDDDDDDSCLLHINNIKKKRNFEDAFGNKFKEQSKTTLPLLLWSGLPNDDDDDDDDKDHTNRLSCCLINNNGEVVEEDDFDDGHVVGWPPIESWRKKVLHHQEGGRGILKKRVAAAVDRGGSKNMYVKVKMEGVAIARKIDLGLFHSYQTLTNSLISMFAKCQQIEKDSANYRLTYLDKDGDWLLAGDVPWQTFIESVQRLELLRNGS